MCALVRVLFLSLLFVITCDSARILAFYPTPSISHQVVFRHLTLELLKRGHELVVITPDPIYSKGETPANLTEVDLHDISYNKWKADCLSFITDLQGTKDSFRKEIAFIYKLTVKLIGDQLSTPEVQVIINNKSQHFDLIILEAYIEPALGLSHVFKAPVIQFSSVGPEYMNLITTGSSTHPSLYPTMMNTRIHNLTFWEKITNFYNFINHHFISRDVSIESDNMLKKILGPDVPSVEVLRENVDLLFLNNYPVWDSNRPVPPNVVYVGGLHQNPEKELPKDIKGYLDSSKNGVIYVSFGTNADAALLPPEKLQAMVNVFSKLPYDILWKWNTDELPGRTDNIRISKWLPQSDLLKHPKIKFFVTQGGMQSTDEAIDAGVPLIGIPMLGDQWYNVEQIAHLKIGLYVDVETITEERLRNAVTEILTNDSYRKNIVRLRKLLRDQPQSALERAVWWTEYVIRHGGARHLRSPAANISWAEYLMADVIVALTAIAIAAILAAVVSIKLILCLFRKPAKKIKRS